MKSCFISFATLTTIFSATTQAASPSNGPSCGAGAMADDSYFSVVGVQGTGVHPRRELRELERDTETWNIFLQAFSRFQAMDQEYKLSYFQIAGIHGAPFGPWDGVEGEGMTGYCPHDSNMFGTWHRPYLALFEQILHDRAVDVANEFPESDGSRDTALETAHKVRLPYWDWAMDPPDGEEGCMPSSLRRSTATVSFPNGTKGEIPNPLYEYDFHPLNYDDFSALSEFQFKNWNHTIRFPADGMSPLATSRNDAANERIGGQQPNNRDILYKLLTVYQPFNQWSNKASGGSIGNIETLHDGLHNVFGLGNMGIVEVSAFDPVFWFHHCNMDRIIALYQARYPDTWIEDTRQPKGTFVIAKDSTMGASSPLAPFHMNAKGDMWTSTTSRNWTSFGYTYPELLNNTSNSTLTTAINKLYKPRTQGLNKNNTLTTLGINNRSADAIDWLAEVSMPTDIQISYSVRAFLGAPSDDPSNWPTDPNYVGQVASMSSPRMASDVILTSTISLTDKLALKHLSGDLPSLNKENVTAWLKENFHWRIQALDFSEIPRDEPPKGLNVTVFSVPVHLPHGDDDVPTWVGEFEYDVEIRGNPPVYDGSGPGGTNETVGGGGEEEEEGGERVGLWNATSGEFDWRNGTNGSANMGARASATGIAPGPVQLSTTTEAAALKTEIATLTSEEVATTVVQLTTVEYVTVAPTP